MGEFEKEPPKQDSWVEAFMVPFPMRFQFLTITLGLNDSSQEASA
jgi:hypothetical protein